MLLELQSAQSCMSFSDVFSHTVNAFCRRDCIECESNTHGFFFWCIDTNILTEKNENYEELEMIKRWNILLPS